MEDRALKNILSTDTHNGQERKQPGRVAFNRQHILIAIVALAGPILYLAWSTTRDGLGFPLDDAWIHQTYARNLVEYGEWAFVPGIPSSGSTAPLWTLLLALGYLLGVPFRIWTYGLGVLALVGTGLLASQAARSLFPTRKTAPLLAALACVLEWHLVWAAVSGMETLLFALLALAMWERLLTAPARRPFLTGLLAGALILTRPEGILVVGLYLLGLLLSPHLDRRWPAILRTGALVAGGIGLVVAPYLALNFRLSGTLWPNTFYAKQAEYAILTLQPLAVRLWRVGTTPWVGAQALLVVGLLRALYLRIRDRKPSRWVELLPLVWAGGTIVLYAMRLPVTYQHGRYLIPIIPVLLVYGVGGTLEMVQRIRRNPLLRIVGRTLMVAVAVLFPIFWALVGPPAYAADVAIIEGEMVTVAHWLEDNTPPNALVAAHDIGAIGYFAQRPLLDMAGLISPEVVPFIRDEEALLAWLEEEEADYLVTFPSWYPVLTGHPDGAPHPSLQTVFITQAEVTREQGQDNMVIYALQWD